MFYLQLVILRWKTGLEFPLIYLEKKIAQRWAGVVGKKMYLVQNREENKRRDNFHSLRGCTSPAFSIACWNCNYFHCSFFNSYFYLYHCSSLFVLLYCLDTSAKIKTVQIWPESASRILQILREEAGIRTEKENIIVSVLCREQDRETKGDVPASRSLVPVWTSHWSQQRWQMWQPQSSGGCWAPGWERD